MISTHSVRNNTFPILLILLMFIPNYGRVFFPKIRESNKIDFLSSFFDSQMLGTYLLFSISLFGILKCFDKVRNTSSQPYIHWVGVTFFISLSLLVTGRFSYSLWRLFEVIALLLGIVLLNAIIPLERGARFVRCIPIYFLLYIIFFCSIWLLKPNMVWSFDIHGYRLGAENEHLMMSPATLGPMCGMLISIFVLYVYRTKSKIGTLLTLPIVALLLIMAVLSGSRTGYIIVIVNLFLISYFSYKWSWTKINPMYLVLAGIPLIGILTAINDNFYTFFISFITRGYGEESLAGFSGRTDVWEFAINMIMSHPIFGLGYANIRPPGFIGHMHNAWLELAVGCGLPSLLLASIFFIKIGLLSWNLSKSSVKYMNNEHRYDLLLTYILLSTAIINSLMSAGFAYYSWPLITILISHIALYSIKRHTLISFKNKNTEENIPKNLKSTSQTITTLIRRKE